LLWGGKQVKKNVMPAADHRRSRKPKEAKIFKLWDDKRPAQAVGHSRKPRRRREAGTMDKKKNFKKRQKKKDLQTDNTPKKQTTTQEL